MMINNKNILFTKLLTLYFSTLAGVAVLLREVTCFYYWRRLNISETITIIIILIDFSDLLSFS